MRGSTEMQSHLGERDTNSCEARAWPQEARPASRPAGSSRSRPRLGVAAEPTAATKFTGRLLPFLLFLLRGIRAAQAGLVVGATTGGRETGALLLSYNFSITSQPRPGPSWCEIQGQVNGNAFLSYACGSKEVKPVGPLGMKLKDTAFWGTQREPLEDLGEELRKKLLDVKAEILMKSDSLTMQGRLMCERGAHGHTRGSWRFAFNEQLTHLFDPENRKWTVVPPGGQQFKGTLDSDGELTKLLMGTANGDCKSWLQQVWERWDEARETTVPPTTPEDSAQTWNILVIAKATKKPLIMGTSSATLPLGQLPLDELLFINRPTALPGLQFQRLQSSHLVQDTEPPMSLLALRASPVQHFPLANSMPFSPGAK